MNDSIQLPERYKTTGQSYSPVFTANGVTTDLLENQATASIPWVVISQDKPYLPTMRVDFPEGHVALVSWQSIYNIRYLPPLAGEAVQEEIIMIYYGVDVILISGYRLDALLPHLQQEAVEILRCSTQPDENAETLPLITSLEYYPIDDLDRLNISAGIPNELDELQAD